MVPVASASNVVDANGSTEFFRDMTIGRRLKQHEAYDSRGSLKFHADKRDYDVPRYKCVALPEATGMSSNVPSVTKCPPGKVPAALLHAGSSVSIQPSPSLSWPSEQSYSFS